MAARTSGTYNNKNAADKNKAANDVDKRIKGILKKILDQNAALSKIITRLKNEEEGLDKKK